MMFRELTLRNFKCFESESIELRKLTFFLGPNNSGKSAALGAIKLLAQTLDSYDRDVSLLLNGKYGEFGTYKDLIYANSVRRELGITISVDRQGSEGKDLVGLDLQYKFNSKEKSVRLKTVKQLFQGEPQVTYKSAQGRRQLDMVEIGGVALNAKSRREIAKRLSFFHFLPNPVFSAKDALKDELAQEQIDILSDGPVRLRQVFQSISSIEYLSALRRAPSRTYAYSGEQHRKVGATGENAMSMLAMDELSRQPSNIKEGVVDWLAAAGIADGISIQDLAGRFFELQVRSVQTGTEQNIADVGFGVSQVLPVLVAGLNAPRRSTFLVEEPEIHLHPRGQAELGEFFVSLANRGVQSLIETHSEYLILRVLQHIASGKISPADVIFYSVSGSSNGCKIEKIEVDGDGVFRPGWPSGFFPERLEEARKLAIARSAKK